MTIQTQVCILGAGAGGTGCAWRLIQQGIHTVVADKNSDFGGTAVFAGVDGWEPGVSLDGIHQRLYEELCKIENGCHVVEIVPNINLFHPENGYNWENHSFEERPWGLSLPMGHPYGETLKRSAALRGEASMKRLQFDPDAMREAIHRVMEPWQEKLTALFGAAYRSCRVADGRVQSITLWNGEEEITVEADYFVDATGDIVLARDAGCAHTMGSEGPEQYGEPSASPKSDRINAVSYIFRIAKAADPEHIDEYTTPDVDIADWCETEMRRVVSCFVAYPNGDINVNMLPTMQGQEYFALGDEADQVGHARVRAYWHYLQTEKGMQGYTLVKIYQAGVRESYRLVGKYVLREGDVRAGLLRQPKVGRTVAIGDHALDIHGESGMCKELEYPYEIPLECTMTREYDNLFVACRGASFTHIASSTVRLTRTMLSLGEGVGSYLAEQLKK